VPRQSRHDHPPDWSIERAAALAPQRILPLRGVSRVTRRLGALMNIVYLAHTCPYPPYRGDRIRCYHILKHLSQSHDLTLLYPVFDHQHSQCRGHLRQYCKSVYPIKYHMLSSYLSCFKALFSSHPLSVSFFHSAIIKRTLQNFSPDIVLVDCSSMAPYALDLPCPKILDFVDIDSQKWKRFASMASFPYSILYQIESKRLAQFEKLLSKRFDYCLVTSPHEKSFLEGVPHIKVLPNGVDHQYFATPYTPVDGSIIFTGVMNYFPNSDAVTYFHDHIFPLIKCQVPAAQFTIAGMYPTAQIRNLTDHHTTVTGFVPDIRAYLSKAAVCVVPLRIAMGVQNKILEAMAMGVPVIATSVANRGINARNEREILVADEPESFAAATTRLLTDQSLRNSIRENAKQFIDAHFRWEKNLQQLDELIGEMTHTFPMRQDSSSY
jgi:sugar transferase (PEP-CTERM/EpsH1 system associated)